MSFATFTDGSANLPGSMLDGITLLPCDYTVDGVPEKYLGDLDSFDGKRYYDMLREGKTVKTTLLNTALFTAHFRPVLRRGEDIICVCMSSNISGTYNAARIAAEELSEEFPERFIHIVDSKGCGFGNGLLAVHSARLSAQGMSAVQAAAVLDEEVGHMCQYFTVDDLNFLKRTGRVSGPTAMIATVLNIKPILYGNSEGQIVSCAKVRGRKKAIEALASKYAEKVVDAAKQIVCISHGDCPEDAEKLAERVKAIAAPAKLVICQHEPFSGSHVGPGMLGLFFRGSER